LSGKKKMIKIYGFPRGSGLGKSSQGTTGEKGGGKAVNPNDRLGSPERHASKGASGGKITKGRGGAPL